MTESPPSASLPFGRRANQVGSVADLIALEQQADKSSLFTDINGLLSHLITRSLRGDQVAHLILDRAQGNHIEFPNLVPTQRTLLEDRYGVAAQQARGAWFLPDEATLRVGLLNLPFNFQHYPRFATLISFEERGNVRLADSPLSVLIWAVLEPLYDLLFLPFELRGPRSGLRSSEDQLKSWEAIDALYQALGLRVDGALGRMRYASGWSRLNVDAQLSIKQAVLTQLAEQVPPDVGARCRAYRVRALVTHYYKKAKDGKVRRKQALTKDLERTLAGFFRGDWLAFLAYLGEEPHSDEQVVTALPAPRLYATGSNRAAEAAAQLGIPVEEAQRIVASFWGESGKTPIERRVAALTYYWQRFDDLHSAQQSGMSSLWGLVADSRMLDSPDARPPYNPGLYRQVLPADLLNDIAMLWGTAMLPRWPESIVTEPFPHVAFAEAFGPALRFWHGCALTAWFLCEGPYSRTDMAGLAEYHASELAALEKMGTPVDPILFRDLIQAEKRLGPPEPILDHQETIESSPGISFTISMSSGNRRSGFERLRDIITRYRQIWTVQHFETYIRARWETELQEAHRAYNVALHEKGKPPTAKQFAKSVLIATNHWFGGDLSGLYAAIGETLPVTPQRRQLMPPDLLTFSQRVQQVLRSKARGSHPTPPLQETDTRFENMARMVPTYIQLFEALGQAPRRQEFTALANEYYWSVLADNLDDAVEVFASAVEVARQDLHNPTSQVVPPAPRHTTPQPVRDPAPGSNTSNLFPDAMNSSASDLPIADPPKPPESGGGEGTGKKSWLHRIFRRDSG